MSRFSLTRNCRIRCLTALLAAAVVLGGCATELRPVAADADSKERVQREFAMQNPALTPQNGGQLVDISALERGDILLSAGKGITTYGIKIFTTSPVSHAALYVGHGDVIEAVGKGVQRRSLLESLDEESVVVAFRSESLKAEQARRIVEFAEAQVGKKYNHLGVILHAPFSLERRLCELPVIPAKVRDFCLRGIASIQLGAVSDKTFFCSQFLLEAYRYAGVPITDADPRWISPADIMHMREGDVPSMRANQTLTYVGHLKYRVPFAFERAPIGNSEDL